MIIEGTHPRGKHSAIAAYAESEQESILLSIIASTALILQEGKRRDVEHEANIYLEEVMHVADEGLDKIRSNK